MAETKRRSPAVFDRALGEWQPQPQFIAFPEFQEAPPAPANPVIAFRIGQDVLRYEDWSRWAKPQYFFFPEFEQPAPAPANPVIEFRQARIHLLPPEAFVLPQSSFAFRSEEPPAPANPVIAFRMGQMQLQRAEMLVLAQYQRFPYVSTVAPPVQAFKSRMGTSVGLGTT